MNKINIKYNCGKSKERVCVFQTTRSEHFLSLLVEARGDEFQVTVRVGKSAYEP